MNNNMKTTLSNAAALTAALARLTCNIDINVFAQDGGAFVLICRADTGGTLLKIPVIMLCDVAETSELIVGLLISERMALETAQLVRIASPKELASATEKSQAAYDDYANRRAEFVEECLGAENAQLLSMCSVYRDMALMGDTRN